MKTAEIKSVFSGYRNVRDRILLCLMLASAFLLRFAALSLKPPHADEGVNGFFVNQILEKGFYTYNPENYHGPLLFYLFRISEKIFGFGVHSFRIVTASFSFFTVLLVFLSGKTLGRYAALFAAVALAFSPGMAFFGRSAIHEPVFVFFQVMWIIGFLKFRETPDRGGILWFSTGLLGCVLLKETFVIPGVSLALAWAWTANSGRLLSGVIPGISSPPQTEYNRRNRIFILKSILAVAVIWLLFFTGFFHHARGAADFFVALVPWLKTATAGAGHEKPFYYWLKLMGQYEWPALVGAGAAVAGFFSRSWKIRFFSSIALLNFLIYSAIPYKTPWCVISIIWPFVIVAGLYAELLFRTQPEKISVVLMAAIAILIAHGVITGYRLNFLNYANAAEPYVYVQTKDDFKIMEGIIEQKIRLSPDAKNMTIQLNLHDSPWPLPWFFSRFPNLQFGEETTAFNPRADIIFTELTRDGSGLRDSYLRRKINLRDGREPFYIYVKESTFKGIYLPGFSPVQDEAPERR